MHQLGCAIWLEASYMKSKVRPPPGVTPILLYATRGEFLDICKTMPEFVEIAYCKAAREAQAQFFEIARPDEYQVNLFVDAEGYPMLGNILHATIIASAAESM